MGDEGFKIPLVEAFEVILGPAKARFRAEREGERVKELVKRMGEYERAERRLEQAQIAFGNGNTACLDETVIPPTPEQLAGGTFERYTADTIAGTARSATTVRRKLMNHVVNYYLSGLIDEQELSACRWYRDVYEATGLTGNIPSTDYQKEIFAAPQSRSMFSDWQIDMQDMFRGARAQMTPRWLPFFDAVVLHDEAPQKSIRLAKKRNGSEKAVFQDAVRELASAYDMLKS
jgi:hypothetical protein